MNKYLLLALLLCSCSGCLWPTYIRPVERMPVIEADEKPQVDLSSLKEPDGSYSLTPRERTLLDALYTAMRYSRVRDARIDAYNTYAETRNKLFEEQGEALGTK